MLVLAIPIGCILGWLSPQVASFASAAVSPLVFILVTLLFFTLPRSARTGRINPRAFALTWSLNFLVVPTLVCIVWYVISPHDPTGWVQLGIALYLLAPCTDWFLGFTRLNGGDTVTGAALIPLHMLTQLLAFPLWIHVAGYTGTHLSPAEMAATIAIWFLAPAVLGLGLRALLRDPRVASAVSPDWVLALLVACVICADSKRILEHPTLFGLMFALVFCFFLTMLAIGNAASRVAGLSYASHVLLSFSTAARNAPMMLGLAVAVFPNATLLHATIVLGMLVEFPHLAAVGYLLRRRQGVVSAQPLLARENVG